MAQLSHGPCFFVTVSSYVRRKVESRLFGVCSGLPGGVSSAEAEVAWLPIIEERVIVARRAFTSCSEAGTETLRAILRLRSASVTPDGV
jgi:hypothetical protein